jgi:predicted RNA-binding Zn-ribbon protein involved in translation (DUF1610 family)
MEAQVCENAMKLCAFIIDPNTNEEFCLSFPLSRMARDISNFNVAVSLDGFDGHLQVEYNKSPVGPYQGPYDQNEALDLNIQLPDSDLDYKKYTEFRHSDTLACKRFAVKESYDDIDDLLKIDAIRIYEETHDSDDESDIGDDDNLQYTCQHGDCRIPCPCFPCCTDEEQCKEHALEHIELFEENVHAVTIRSTEEYFNDEGFLNKSYLIKHPGIPLGCPKCKRDFLHHVCYHLDLHRSCKFCRQNRFKTFAETVTEFDSSLKKHEHFLKSVCPHCKNKFCEPYLKKKHVEFEHENAPFKCDHCATKFHSEKAKDYHELVHHSKFHEREKCKLCDKTFTAKVSLLNHMKYVHSEERMHQCSLCESNFKQKKDKNVHLLNIHGVNMSKAMLGNEEEFENHECSECEAKYKYRKDLNAHVRLKHENRTNVKSFDCDQCPSKFKEKKTLTAHMKMKHSKKAAEFPCPTCGKVFNQKNNMKRHQKTHNVD